MKGHGQFGAIAGIIVLILGVLLFYYGYIGNALEPMFSMILGLALGVLGVVGLVK